MRAVPEAQRAVLPLLDADRLSARSPCVVGWIEDVQHPLVVQRQALRDEAGLLPANDAGQVVGRLQRAVSIVLASRSSGEATVVVRHELRSEGVRGLHIVDLSKPQLLAQPVLQRQVSTLDAALRRRRVGAEDVDVQAAQGSAELRDASPALGLLLVHSEHPGLLAVERYWLASIIQCRSVSTESRKPCSSVSFSWASVGPKPSYWLRTVASASRRSSQGSRRLLGRPRCFDAKALDTVPRAQDGGASRRRAVRRERAPTALPRALLPRCGRGALERLGLAAPQPLPRPALPRADRPAFRDRAPRTIERIGERLPVGITPCFASLMDLEDPAEPIRRTMIPVGAKLIRSAGEADAPLDEDGDSPVPGLVHRAPDRVLFHPCRPAAEDHACADGDASPLPPAVGEHPLHAPCGAHPGGGAGVRASRGCRHPARLPDGAGTQCQRRRRDHAATGARVAPGPGATLLAVPVRPHPRLRAPAHSDREGTRDRSGPTRPHYRLRGPHLRGYAAPTFVVDGPGEGEKIGIYPRPST